MTSSRNILLVGFMGSGKSRIGRELARGTGWPLLDADDEIVRRAGKPISQMFQEDGEDAFRNLERQVIQHLCAGSGRIIAAGGGAFVDPENRERMLAAGTVVCLDARPETILQRVGGGARRNRPDLWHRPQVPSYKTVSLASPSDDGKTGVTRSIIATGPRGR